MKYIPTVRDQKAVARFLNKQKQVPNYKKSSDKTLADKTSPDKKPAAKS